VDRAQEGRYGGARDADPNERTLSNRPPRREEQTASQTLSDDCSSQDPGGDWANAMRRPASSPREDGGCPEREEARKDLPFESGLLPPNSHRRAILLMLST
jgi:hypothetical protein